MAEGEVTRRLAAIVAADVAGYSRLIAEDEEGTFTAFLTHRAELIDPKITEYRGRIANTAGDSLLMEFPSIVEALRFAIDLQRSMSARNAEIAIERRIEFRIGVNLGDVIEQDGDLLGDGVNVAARLEGLAPPGGICLSRAARDQVRDRLKIDLEDMGEIEVKNVARPIRVFQVITDPARNLDVADKATPTRWLKPGAVATLAVFVLAGGSALAWLQPWKTEAGQVASSLSAKISIVVLPFSNLSRDPEHEYFSDGITNDLITDLSKFHELFVIASNSSFQFKGKPVDVKSVGRELGVKYVLEGSVQKLDDRIRINAQLIDATNANHLWAERYDEAVANLFDLQERITKEIVRTLAVRLSEIEQDRAFDKPTDNLEAYDHALRGWQLLLPLERTKNFEARRHFRMAIERDPDYATAYAGLGYSHLYAVHYGWGGSPALELKKAEEFARRSIALNDTNVHGHRLLGMVYLALGQYDLALFEVERAIALNPNDAESHMRQGIVHLWSGHPEGAILSLETALRYDPKMNCDGMVNLGLAYYLNSRYKDAVNIAERCVRQNPDYQFGYVVLAATYGQMGNQNEATYAARAIKRLNPYFSIKNYGTLFRDPTDTGKVVDGLRKAGLR